MGITYFEHERVFQIQTPHTTYLCGLTAEGYLGHMYYGRRMEAHDGRHLLRTDEPPFTPSVNLREKSSFLDVFPMEYSFFGVGDYRESCLKVRTEQGAAGCELLYREHRIFAGKPALSGLPAAFGDEASCQTLEITCEDKLLGLDVVLSYSVFDDSDAILRSVRVENRSDREMYLEKVFSACLDMDDEQFDMLTLCGSWARERVMERRPLGFGKQSVSSVRGESSHQEHPFLALLDRNATQEQGSVYAMHFIYSGNFLAQAEKSQFGYVRMTMGIHPEAFEWKLEPGAVFQAPEAVLVYSDCGLDGMTHTLHDLYRKHLIRSAWLNRKRPVLINNWEATYFDFDREKILEIAREAAGLGIEMLVLDDGWFGQRNFDDSSLGDWTVNEEKLPGGLSYLADKIEELGMRFGLWFEPEMISPNSRLYEAHPDWAIQLPRRTPTQIRAQYVLDLSRQEVVDYVYEAVAAILRSAKISYVKWDMNRQLCDVGSAVLPSDRQGELSHRYMLGVYQLQERLLAEFPELLLENCSGGGARFDPGMLYYSPQIWCSDDTDAVERLAIQEGTALLYPLSCMGAHVSVCPNHITGRNTPFATRGNVALAGTFGYELDVTKLADEEKQQIPHQIAQYHKYSGLMRCGDYWRIASYRENRFYDCWQVVSKDRSETLLTYVQVMARPNYHSRKIRLKGLEPGALYCLEGTEQEYSGEMLMQGGFLLPELSGDGQSRLYHFVKAEN